MTSVEMNRPCNQAFTMILDSMAVSSIQTPQQKQAGLYLVGLVLTDLKGDISKEGIKSLEHIAQIVAE